MKNERISNRYAYSKVKGTSFKTQGKKGESLTQNQFAKDVDLKNIVKRFMKTGVLDQNDITKRQAVFGDFSNVQDYTDMMIKVRDFEFLFAGLPGKVRERFSNDPAELLAFVKDPNNAQECVNLGLFPADKGNTTQPEPEAPVEPPIAPQGGNPPAGAVGA